MTDQDLTGYCGLYCGDCIRYQSKISDLASELLRQLDERQYADYAKVKQARMPEFACYDAMIKCLGAVARIKCEVPCGQGGDGCGGSCDIIRCVKGKSLAGCWDCAEFETCRNLDFLVPFHGDTPLNNLRKIREAGINAWAKHRGRFYPWLR